MLLYAKQALDECNVVFVGLQQRFPIVFVAQPEFPRPAPLLLSESQRFDNRIARLANTVAISAEQMHGTENDFSAREICHIFYLFPKDKAERVIEEFGQLILDTFSEEELLSNKRVGCHVVGMVHVKKDETPEKQFPKRMDCQGYS